MASSRLVLCPHEKRTGFPDNPIASNTKESFEEDEEHAEPVDLSIPCISKAITIISPGI